MKTILFSKILTNLKSNISMIKMNLTLLKKISLQKLFSLLKTDFTLKLKKYKIFKMILTKYKKFNTNLRINMNLKIIFHKYLKQVLAKIIVSVQSKILIIFFKDLEVVLV